MRTKVDVPVVATGMDQFALVNLEIEGNMPQGFLVTATVSNGQGTCRGLARGTGVYELAATAAFQGASLAGFGELITRFKISTGCEGVYVLADNMGYGVAKGELNPITIAQAALNLVNKAR